MEQETKQRQRQMTGQGTGILLVLIATVSLSTEAVAAKIAYAGGANVVSALTFRYIIAALLFITGIFLFKMPYRLAKKDIARIAVLALGAQSATVLLLFHSFRFIPAAMAILFLYLYPTIVTFLAVFLLKEPLTRRKVVALVLTLGGCAVILGQPLNGLDPPGILLAIGAAVTNALFLIGSTRLINHIGVPVYNAYMTGIIAVFFTILGTTTGQLNLEFSLRAWGALLVLGVICTVVALTTLFQGVKKIGASRAAIISTFEPVSTAVLGLLFLHEGITGWQAAGGALVLLGVFLQRRE